ncbi:hypothetical protein D3C81_1846490 [compost metagenome]
MAVAFAHTDNIEEEAVQIIARHDLAGLGNQDIQVRRVHAELVISRFQEALHPVRLIVFVPDKPFRMAPGQLLIQTGR